MAYFDFDNTPITKDTDLKAKYKCKGDGYTVSFDLDGGQTTYPIEDQVVPEGETATRPDQNPTKDGCEFIDWYQQTESDPNPSPDPGAGGTINVMFRTDGGSPQPDGQEIKPGEIVSYPGAVAKEGCSFLGWYKAGELPDGQNSYLVTFDTGDGGSTVMPMSVWEGNTVTEPSDPTRDGYDFGGWLLDGQPYDFLTPITGDITLTAGWVMQPVDYIEIKITDIGTQSSTIGIGVRWNTNGVVVEKVVGENTKALTTGQSYTFKAATGDVFRIKQKYNGAFRSWLSRSSGSGLVMSRADISPYNNISWETADAKAVITKMPPISMFTTDADGKIAPDNFFAKFNSESLVESFPDGALDTSSIEQVGENFFRDFNYRGKWLKELPSGALDTSKIRSGLASNLSSNVAIPDNFFRAFNEDGALESLPAGSFDISGVNTIVQNYFFAEFNYNGALTSLPEGSFDTSGITTEITNYGFYRFNCEGKISSLPAGSFVLSSEVKSIGTYAFTAFNSAGSLESLPLGSFDTSNVTTFGNNAFSYFNNNGALTEGNRLVKIYAVSTISNFKVGTQNSISAGNYGYVNGT